MTAPSKPRTAGEAAYRKFWCNDTLMLARWERSASSREEWEEIAAAAIAFAAGEQAEEQPKCPRCGGSGEEEDDAHGALGYVVKVPCPECGTGKGTR